MVSAMGRAGDPYATDTLKSSAEAVYPQRLNYSEVCQLAYEGAKVIHPVAVEVAMSHNLSVAVRGLTETGTIFPNVIIEFALRGP